MAEKLTGDFGRGHKESRREWLGRRVRELWVEWAYTQPDRKESWLIPWDELDESQKEVDRRIGMGIWCECIDMHSEEIADDIIHNKEIESLKQTIADMSEGYKETVKRERQFRDERDIARKIIAERDKEIEGLREQYRLSVRNDVGKELQRDTARNEAHAMKAALDIAKEALEICRDRTESEHTREEHADNALTALAELEDK